MRKNVIYWHLGLLLFLCSYPMEVRPESGRLRDCGIAREKSLRDTTPVTKRGVVNNRPAWDSNTKVNPLIYNTISSRSSSPGGETRRSLNSRSDSGKNNSWQDKVWPGDITTPLGTGYEHSIYSHGACDCCSSKKKSGEKKSFVSSHTEPSGALRTPESKKSKEKRLLLSEKKAQEEAELRENKRVAIEEWRAKKKAEEQQKKAKEDLKRRLEEKREVEKRELKSDLDHKMIDAWNEEKLEKQKQMQRLLKKPEEKNLAEKKQARIKELEKKQQQQKQAEEQKQARIKELEEQKRLRELEEKELAEKKARLEKLELLKREQEKAERERLLKEQAAERARLEKLELLKREQNKLEQERLLKEQEMEKLEKKQAEEKELAEQKKLADEKKKLEQKLAEQKRLRELEEKKLAEQKKLAEEKKKQALVRIKELEEKNTWRRFPISNNGAVCYNGQVIKEKEASGTVRLADEKRDWIFTNSTGTVTISGLFIKNRLQLLKGVTVSYRDGGFFYGLSLPEAAGNTNPDIDISSQWINDIPRWLVSGDKKTENILLAGVGGPGGNASSVSHVLLFSKAQNSFSYFGSVHRYSRCNNCNNIVVPNGDGLMIIEGKKGDDELVVNRGRFKNGELVSGTTAKVTRTKVTRKK